MNDENKIMIYDSVYSAVDNEVRETIYKLFYCTNNTYISLAPMQKQDSASNNCGVFAIAAARLLPIPVIHHFYILRKRKCENISVIALKMVP